jgi:hypothetical protein
MNAIAIIGGILGALSGFCIGYFPRRKDGQAWAIAFGVIGGVIGSIVGLFIAILVVAIIVIAFALYMLPYIFNSSSLD